ncbi:MAG: stage II sporulation protein M [Planctomycetota bacterium]
MALDRCLEGKDGNLPDLYRQVARDLALARERGYSQNLLERLNSLVLAGHERLYRKRKAPGAGLGRFLLVEYPAMVRARWQRFLVCVLAFFGPFALLALLGPSHPDWIFAALSDGMMANLDSMYAEPSGIGKRSAELGFFAFAHYIKNNVGIDFMVFAGGMLAAVGSMFFMVYNGVVIGAAFGYVLRAGYHDQFLPFVAGHGAFELTAICLSGLAGMELGFSWLHPGEHTRRASLVAGGRRALRLLAGAGVLTSMAAVIEGFWSPGPMSPTVKYAVGGTLWFLTILWLAVGGLRRAD